MSPSSVLRPSWNLAVTHDRCCALLHRCSCRIGVAAKTRLLFQRNNSKHKLEVSCTNGREQQADVHLYEAVLSPGFMILAEGCLGRWPEKSTVVGQKEDVGNAFGPHITSGGASLRMEGLGL